MTAFRKNILVLFIFCGVSVWSAAQIDSSEYKLLKPRELKSFGKNAMIQGDYSAATVYFKLYMKVRAKDDEVAFKLAESYRLNRDYKRAMKWYEKAYEFSGKKYAPALYYQALMQKMEGDCVGAKTKFLAFKKQKSSDDLTALLKKRLKYQIQGCDSVAPKPVAKIAVKLLDTSINKIHVEAAPYYLNDSTIIYSALRTNKREFIIEGDTATPPVRKLYRAVRRNGEWKFDGEFEGFNSVDANISGGSFSDDGKRFYFSRCSKNWKNKMICGIYVSNFKNGAWTEPEALSEEVNLPDYSSSQPSVAKTAKGQEIIYFSSDREGGRGGYDIWYILFDTRKKKYTAPRNASSKINTALDEMSPFYDQNTASLYFSSEGWPGIGGLDVFKAIGELNRFGKAENMGKPVNSTYDDLFYTISKGRDKGMLISNRPGGYSLKSETCCDDLYEFLKMEFINITIEGTLYGGPDSLSMKKMPDGLVDIYLVDPDSKGQVFVKTVNMNEASGFTFTAEPENTYKIVGRKENYLNNTVVISTKGITSDQKIVKDLKLIKIPEVFRLENVYYELDKHNLTDKSMKSLDTTLIPLLVENPEIKIEIGAHTDDQGGDKYNLTLSQKRAEGVVNYLILKGINPDRLEAKGYGETSPLVPNLNPDGSGNKENRAKNRRTEFKVIGKVDIEIIEREDEKLLRENSKRENNEEND